MPEFRAPTGTRDVLPPESARWARLVALFAVLAERAGYGLVVSPMFEDVGVFERIGESTDIVRKEMYDFKDKSDRHLALRPEGTASVMRAFIEHHPTTPWKTWYVGPNFRYERPQAGRYRQHHQLGAEAIGTDDPDVDVEIIALLDSVYRAVGLEQRRLRLNSIGDALTCPAYIEALRAHLTSHAGALSEQSRATMQVNPLRVLDSKRPEDAPIIATAPITLDYLSPDATAHFERVQRGLQSLGIAFDIDPLLVRGLDYYARTTFEFRERSPGLGPERDRRRRALRRSRGAARWIADTGHRLRRRHRAHPPRLRRGGCVRRAQRDSRCVGHRHDRW